MVHHQPRKPYLYLLHHEGDFFKWQMKLKLKNEYTTLCVIDDHLLATIPLYRKNEYVRYEYGVRPALTPFPPLSNSPLT